ncbi:toxin regulator [Clostridium beijerinckii]|uniref:toxin regulator n=1 Tax=Clostridium beijerinckii TaxID=1520 RepID=UPI002431F9B6|nr:toxin regulator [Clostridium beijerinckii]MDG5852501.1 toxin regulator [Clostridium beijerinckii]
MSEELNKKTKKKKYKIITSCILLLMLVAIMFCIVNVIRDESNTKNKVASVKSIEFEERYNKIRSEQKVYAQILDSDQTYDQMSADVQSNTDKMILYWNDLDQDFKSKYQAKKELIEASKNKYLEAQAKANAEKEADAKVAQKAAQEEAERIGYDTGITYEQLARTPDEYKGKKAKFSGKVLQVIEGDKENDLRIAVDENYDNVLFVGYDPKITSTRILENDQVTVKGTSIGIYSYQSTLGGKISIPGMWVDKIELNK